MKILSYKDLIVWQKSIDLVVLVYKVTKKYPSEEKFGLVSQSRRSAVGVPSNIAEGFTRRHLGEYLQFLYISLASLFELETQLIIAERLKYYFYSKDLKTKNLILEIEKC